jgi:hypothetical protein
MLRVHIRHRGRDLAVHTVDSQEEADELVRVYILLGYPEDRIVVEDLRNTDLKAA